jgi:virginiamycin B lyase
LLWVANCQGGEVWRINLKTAAVEAKIATGLANPKGETNVIPVAGSVWVPSDPQGRVARIDPATNAILATIAVAPETWYLAAGFDAVWAVSSEGRLLQRIDPATLKIRARMGPAVGSGALRWMPAGVWTSAHDNQTLSWWSTPAPAAP